MKIIRNTNRQEVPCSVLKPLIRPLSRTQLPNADASTGRETYCVFVCFTQSSSFRTRITLH